MSDKETVDSDLLGVLKNRFGHDGFLPLQGEIVRNVLAGRDSLVLMPTGGGKSICYQLPAVILDGLTLVVSPLIALMKDQVDALRSRGVRAAFINSTMTQAEITKVQLEAYNGLLDILYVAPERLVLQRFGDFLHAVKLGLIAIDEAHCISEWGHDFRPDYRNLQALRDQFPGTPLIALTATATERVREDVLHQLKMLTAERFISSFNRPNLTYRVLPKRRSYGRLTALLRGIGDGSAIIYRFSRKDTEDLAFRLSGSGFKALPYHAGLEDDVRRRTQEQFISGEVPIIVATIAFGMGVDKPNIRLVVHYDLPKTIEGYYQETGRAGRDGMPSDCVLFFTLADRSKQEYFIRQIEDAAERASARERLASVVEYGSGNSCRRRFLLAYFGERLDQDNCNSCDVCLANEDAVQSGVAYDGTVIAQQVLSAIIRTGQRFGASHIVGVLRGSRAKRIVQRGHDKLRVHGVARGLSRHDLFDVVDQLVRRGLVAHEMGEFPTLSVTQLGRDFLRKRETIELVRQSNGPIRGNASSTAPANDSYIDRVRRTHPRAYESWTHEEDRRLLEMFDSGRSIDDIAADSGRRPSAIVSRLNRSQRTRPVNETSLSTLELLREGLTLAEIAQRRGITEGTVLGHLERLVRDGRAPPLAHLMPEPRRYERIEHAFLEMGQAPLRPVKDLLGDDYSYEELRLVKMRMRQLTPPPPGQSD